MSTDSNSTELTILTHAPQMVARAFDGARSTLGDSRDRLRRKLAFVDSLLRYLFAVLAAENAGLGLPLPEGCTSLVNRLATPSWGDWSKAIEAFARRILESEREPVAPEFPSLVIKTEESGNLVRSPFFDHLLGLIDLRNEVAHDDGSVFCTEGKAGQHLQEKVNPALQQVAAGLRVFAKRPLLYIDGSRDLLDGDVVSTFLRLVGEKPEQQECRCAAKPAIRERYPFLLNETGAVLYLSPFIMVEGAAVSGVPAPRLIDGWSDQSHQPTYDFPDGQRRQPLAASTEGMPNSPRALLSLPAKTFRREAVIDPDTAKVVASAHRMPVHVTIPGLEIDEERPLGTGASGTVYRARWAPGGGAPKEWLAVKVLRGTFLADVQRVRLEAEYNVLKTIQHECLPRVHHFGYDPLPYFVMEKVDGTSLQARIDRRPLPLETVVWLAQKILDVLELVHSQGVIHRDLKPSNIMITEDDTALKVIDFGIALTNQDRRVTGSLELVGTHGYAAPEQFARGSVDHRADLYSLGRVLQAALVGNQEGRVDAIPEGMQAIIFQATQPNPDHRFASAAEMRAALDERQAGNWKGVPVQGNSPLDANHHLLDLKHSIDDVWVFDAIEVPTKRRQAVALAVKPAARQLLLDAVRRQPDGACTTQLTGVHSILFTVLPPDDEARRLERLLAGRSLWSRRPLPPAKGRSSPSSRAEPLPGAEAGCLQSAIRRRLRELKDRVDGEHEGDSVATACLEAASAFESILLVWALHAVRAGAIDEEAWRSCPQSLVGIVNWVVKLPMPRGRVDELLHGLRKVADIRNHLAHERGQGPAEAEIVHAVVLACVLLDEAIAAAIPDGGAGQKMPFLDYDQARQAWLLMRPLRGEERIEVYDQDWHRERQAEERVAARSEKVDFERGYAESIRRAIGEWLATRPYSHEVIYGFKSVGTVSVREADILIRADQDRVALVVEIKMIANQKRYGELQRARTREALWRHMHAFGAPFALLDENGERTWFADDGMKGLREMPDDSEIVARFPAAKPKA